MMIWVWKNENGIRGREREVGKMATPVPFPLLFFSYKEGGGKLSDTGVASVMVVLGGDLRGYVVGGFMVLGICEKNAGVRWGVLL